MVGGSLAGPPQVALPFVSFFATFDLLTLPRAAPTPRPIAPSPHAHPLPAGSAGQGCVASAICGMGCCRRQRMGSCSGFSDVPSTCSGLAARCGPRKSAPPQSLEAFQLQSIEACAYTWPGCAPHLFFCSSLTDASSARQGPGRGC